MIDRQHALPLAKQAKALGISRGTLYYVSRPVPAADLALMRRIDELHLEYNNHWAAIRMRGIYLSFVVATVI